MKGNILIAALIIALVFGVVTGAQTQTGSDNYGIQNSLQSGGGTAAASANYQMNSTVGQPSPLMDPIEPPFSDTYDLYPGFWYVIAADEIVDVLKYTPVPPCKIVDTRNTSGGIINPSTPRDFHVFGGGGTIGDQGGNPAGCPSPGGDPLAAHISMVAVDPTGKGNLKAFPVGAGSNAGLAINYNAIDTNLANAGTVKTIAGTGPDITVATQHQSAHLTIQVLGYYYPAPTP